MIVCASQLDYGRNGDYNLTEDEKAPWFQSVGEVNAYVQPRGRKSI